MRSYQSKIIPAEFYRRKTERVARDLLGCTLVHILDGKRRSGRIVETEAYLGATDPACHTFGHRRTPRNASMYLPGGHAYVYFIYGMHFCFNAVTRSEKHPEAVLIRALEPLDGINLMRSSRACRRDRDLTNGPAKLCQAMGIDRSCDGVSLFDSPSPTDARSHLFIEEKPKNLKLKIIASPRIGVDYAGSAALWPLRFSISENSFVSRSASVSGSGVSNKSVPNKKI